MGNYKDKIKEFEDELAKTKYNKRTQYHVGLIKAKIAAMKQQQEKSSGKKPATDGYSVRKTGDGTVILVGYPSVGKSTLLNALTNAQSRVAAYAFTTLTVVPGLMKHKHAKIQILDVPGIVMGAAAGTGRGKEVLSVMRNADMVVFVVDVCFPEHYPILQKEVYDAHIRVNSQKPTVKIHKTAKDGIRLGATVKLTKLNPKIITSILHEFKIINAEVVIRSDLDADELIDAIEDNKHYIPGLIVVNKIDMVAREEAEKVMKQLNADIGISAMNRTHIEDVKDLIFKKLDLMRLYLKEPGKKADLEEPLIIFSRATVGDLCNKLHKDFYNKYRFARIWGKSVRFDGQKVLNKNHVLMDEDIVELHIS